MPQKLETVAAKSIKHETSLLENQPDLVREIQEILIELNLLNPPPDGIFGQLTAEALREFQRRSQTEEKGYFGSNTAIKLLSANSLEFTSLRLVTIKDTFFKTKPLQSMNLRDCEKEEMVKKEEFEIISYAEVRNHINFCLKNRKIKGRSNWYAYSPHVEIYEENRKIFPRSLPESKKIKISYKSQLDNFYNPTGSCNVTSVAMCLDYLGVKCEYGQLEDELYEYALTKNYNRHSPYDLAKIVRDYGKKDTFKKNANFKEIKSWLNTDLPVVVHGYFTSFGHIIVIVGYNNEGFIVHDPYGEWFSTGYRTDLSGAYLNYSYGLITNTCMSDGDLWAHFISN